MRHRFLFVVFIIMVFCGGSGKLNAQERLNFAYISPNAGSSSVLWVAKDAGIFKKHGLDVNIIYIEGTPKALMSLTAGPVPMIMGFEVFLPYYLIATPAIKSIEDLKGKVGRRRLAAHRQSG